MKKYLFFVLSIVLLADVAYARTAEDDGSIGMCSISLENSGVTCSKASSADSAMWWASCSLNSTSVHVEGIGMCSRRSASVASKVSDLVNVNSVADKTNFHCWCKMIEPYLSYYWVYAANLENYTNCKVYCALNCGNALVSSSSFRTAIFR